MSLTNIQLNWLRTFEAVGRHLSFSAAAMELNMSQSAVSQQIKLLEHKLGKPLFFRQTRAIQLTVSGRAYLAVVREGLWHIEQGKNSIFNSVAEGVLELRVNNSFAQLWLAPRIDQFIELYPQISLRMYGINWEADEPPSSAELEIRYGGGQWPHYSIQQLLSTDIKPYCSLGVASRLRSAGGLLSIPLIDVLGTPNGWSDWLSAHRQSDVESYRRFFVDSYAIAASMAIEGAGVCLLNEALVEKSRLHEQLISPFDQSINCQAGFYLLKPDNRPLSGAAQVFCSWLESELK